jgi:hypothetical protein
MWVEVAVSAGQLAVGAGATYAIARGRRAIQRRPFHQIWNALLGDAEVVNIVYADVALPEFEIAEMREKSRLPRNVPLLGVQEAVGLAAVAGALRQHYGNRRIEVNSARDFHQYEETVISIGGPSVNRVTKEFLEKHKLDSKFSITYPAHVAADAADGSEYRCDERDDEIVGDYGFIFIAPNPLNPSNTVCILFGIWPQGSRAATKMLVEPERSDPHFKDFLARVQARSGVFAVVKSAVMGLRPGEPKFIKVRGLQ